jgi:hypothetical protein
MENNNYSLLLQEYQELQQECQEQARLNGMGSEREAKLLSTNAELEKELKQAKSLIASQDAEIKLLRNYLDVLRQALKDTYNHKGTNQ